MNFKELIAACKNRLKLNIDTSQPLPICVDKQFNAFAQQHPQTFGSLEAFIADIYKNITHIYHVEKGNVILYMDPDAMKQRKKAYEFDKVMTPKGGFVFSNKHKLAEYGLISEEVKHNDKIIPLLYSFEKNNNDPIFSTLDETSQQLITNLLVKIQKELPNFVFIPIDDRQDLPKDIKANIHFQDQIQRIPGSSEDFSSFTDFAYFHHGVFTINLNINFYKNAATQYDNMILDDFIILNLLQALPHVLGIGHPFGHLKSENDFIHPALVTHFHSLHNVHSHMLFFNTSCGWYHENKRENGKFIVQHPMIQNISALTKAVFSSLYGEEDLPKTNMAVYSFYQEKSHHATVSIGALQDTITQKEQLTQLAKEADKQAIYKQEQSYLNSLKRIYNRHESYSKNAKHIAIKGDMSGFTIHPQCDAAYVVFDLGDFATHYLQTTPTPIQKPILDAVLQPLGCMWYSDAFTNYNHVTQVKTPYMTQIGCDFTAVHEVILSPVSDNIHITSPLYQNIRVVTTPHGLDDYLSFYHGGDNQLIVCQDMDILTVKLERNAGITIDLNDLKYTPTNKMFVSYDKQNHTLSLMLKEGGTIVNCSIVAQNGLTYNGVRFKLNDVSKTIKDDLFNKTTKLSLASLGF